MRFPSVLVVAALATAVLAGCAGNTVKSTSRTFGLTSGPLPQPQPFVVESRPAPTKVFPVIGTQPPPRSDRILSMSERKSLEAGLLATPGRQATSPERKSANKKAANKRKAQKGAQDKSAPVSQ